MSHPLSIAFIWHMHQPYYRDLVTGECSMPWVRLHGTKDYLDMVKLLEAFPTIHQTVNVAPSLIDQLEEYLPPLNRSDHFLDCSRKAASDLTQDEKRFLLEWFFLAHWDHMVKPYPRYHDLFAKRGAFVDDQTWPDLLKRFKPQDYLDLQVWFNLTWIDPWLRGQDPDLAALEAKGQQFTEEEKHRLLEKQRGILQDILPTYRAAQARGQIELTTSPYYHPILPLLCDIRSAHAALPQLPMPEVSFRHREDARWHVTSALQRHEAVFGRRPVGLWPPEGSVSEEVVQLAIEERLRWIATDETILWRTLHASRSPALLYRPHLLHRKGGSLAIVFRDRELSDLIGFVYSQWNAAIAIQDFLKRCEGIYHQMRAVREPSLVTIILDGENAWEHYPRDGHEFLQGLYQALAKDERFRLVTVSEFLEQVPVSHSASLPDLFAGSWIDGNFSTWIGHPEKNAAWTALAQARSALHAHRPSPEEGTESVEKATRSFYIAEGSDWLWWFGDTHHSAQDEEFDRLFRAHVSNVYRSMGHEIPSSLHLPIKKKAIQPVQEPTAAIHPVIDGLDTTYYEWLYAGRFDLRKGYAAAHRGQQVLQAFYYGSDHAHYYFRLDMQGSEVARLERWRITFELLNRHAQMIVEGTARTAGVTANLEHQQLPCAYRRILECAVPKTLLSGKAGEGLQLRVTFSHGTTLLERYPPQGAFQLSVPPADLEAQSWSV